MTVCWVGKRVVFVSSVRDNLGPLSHQTRNCQPCHSNHNQRYFGVSHTSYERMTQWKSHSIGGTNLSHIPLFLETHTYTVRITRKTHSFVRNCESQTSTGPLCTFLRCTEFAEGPEKIATMNRVRMNHSCCQKNWDSSTHRSLAIHFFGGVFLFLSPST